MNMLRHPLLRRVFVTVFLLSSLLVQTQTLYACNLMDTAASPVCCCGEHMDQGCHMGGGCDSEKMNTGCCDISVEASPYDLSMASGVDNLIVALLTAPQPPPALPVETITLHWPASTETYIERYALPPWLTGTHTYFSTQRIRS